MHSFAVRTKFSLFVMMMPAKKLNKPVSPGYGKVTVEPSADHAIEVGAVPAFPWPMHPPPLVTLSQLPTSSGVIPAKDEYDSQLIIAPALPALRTNTYERSFAP